MSDQKIVIDEVWGLSFCRDWIMGDQSRDDMRREFQSQHIDYAEFKEFARNHECFHASMENLRYTVN